LTNIIEVLHQFAIDVSHGVNAIWHWKLGNISNPLDNGRPNVHPLLGEVLAEIGKERAFLRQLFLLSRQRIQPLLVLVTVGSNLLRAPDVSCDRFSFSSFDISLELLLDFWVPSYTPFRLRFLCCSSWSLRSDSFS
jgi:hypothetical protein